MNRHLKCLLDFMKSLRFSHTKQLIKAILSVGVRQDNYFVFAFPLSIWGIIYPQLNFCNKLSDVSLAYFGLNPWEVLQ